jgi:hypothetical protein
VTAALREAGELSERERITTIEQLLGGWSRHSFIAEAQLASGDIRRYVVRAKPRDARLMGW